jgi:two-component sensor histidine kinase
MRGITKQLKKFLNSGQPIMSADSLRNLQQRVHALGLIHHKLMESEDLERIGLEKFVSTLCQAELWRNLGDEVFRRRCLMLAR